MVLITKLQVSVLSDIPVTININHKKFFRRFLVSAARFLVVFNHFWICKICRSSTYHRDIKENIITKLQKVYSPLRNFRVCNKSPMLSLKKPLCMGHLKPGPKIFTEMPVIVRLKGGSFFILSC